MVASVSSLARLSLIAVGCLSSLVLESDSTALNQTRRLFIWWGMIFSDNRFPLFGIMPWSDGNGPPQRLMDDHRGARIDRRQCLRRLPGLPLTRASDTGLN